MALIQLDVAGFRCIEHARLHLDPRCNLIIGPNASGKTSLLEAIFALGSGRSFLTHQSEHLIRRGSDHFLTVGHVETGSQLDVIGLQGWRDRKEGRVNGETARSLAELAIRFPVQSIDPDVHQLVEEGPRRRREFLDWGVFHVEPRFHDTWRRYQRALRQRNAALKSESNALTTRIWDQDLAEQGEVIARLRDSYIAVLRPFIQNLGRSLLGLDVDIEHQQGWRRGMSLSEALDDSWERDRGRAGTMTGPHRADVTLKVATHMAKDRISRGQQKLLACTLILAQQLHRSSINALPACLLLDDPAAELDVDNLGKLLTAIVQIPTQLVVTGLNESVLEFFPGAKLFHVEHGFVKAVA